jgi:hypothetical protein
MTPAVTQLEEIHARLTDALEDPRTIGLRKGAVPQPLDDLLRSTQCALGQLLIEIREEGSGSSLEVELSQDADR